MGCCFSCHDNHENTSGQPFNRDGISWTGDPPLMRDELARQRAEFWETAPSFGGRLHIWRTLEMAFNEDDIANARAILDAANIKLPTGNPMGGCYDEFGFNYEIPVFCLVDPSNLIRDTPKPVAQAQSNEEPQSSTVLGAVESNFPILVRLSTGKDITIMIRPDGEPVKLLMERVFLHPDACLERAKHRLRIFYLARELSGDTMIVGSQGLPEEARIVRMLANIPTVKVYQGDTIQVFVVHHT